MFGYIRPVRSEMLVKEAEYYDAVYCGLCRCGGKKISHLTRYLLNYDFTFLALLRISLTGEKATVELKRCPYKIRKKTHVVCDPVFTEVNGYFGILTYYKLLDDVQDGKGFKRFAKKCLLPFGRHLRKKALRTGVSEEIIRKPLDDLRALEKENCPSPDRTADCFGSLMRSIASAGITDPDTKAIAEQCGYHIGRFVYLIDALDDLEDDAKSGNYNPFLTKYGSLEEALAQTDAIRLTLEDSMRVFSRTYELHCGPNLTGTDRILLNICDLGGPEAVRQVLSRKRKDTH